MPWRAATRSRHTERKNADRAPGGPQEARLLGVGEKLLRVYQLLLLMSGGFEVEPTWCSEG